MQLQYNSIILKCIETVILSPGKPQETANLLCAFIPFRPHPQPLLQNYRIYCSFTLLILSLNHSYSLSFRQMRNLILCYAHINNWWTLYVHLAMVSTSWSTGYCCSICTERSESFIHSLLFYAFIPISKSRMSLLISTRVISRRVINCISHSQKKQTNFVLIRQENEKQKTQQQSQICHKY